jgi:hypothetical protein
MPWRCMGGGCIEPCILKLGISWYRFTLRLLYPRGKRPQYPLDSRGLGASQNRPGWRWDEKKILPLPGFELQPIGCPARSQSLSRVRQNKVMVALDGASFSGRFIHELTVISRYWVHWTLQPIWKWWHLDIFPSPPRTGPSSSSPYSQTFPVSTGLVSPSEVGDEKKNLNSSVTRNVIVQNFIVSSEF